MWYDTKVEHLIAQYGKMYVKHVGSYKYIGIMLIK